MISRLGLVASVMSGMAAVSAFGDSYTSNSATTAWNSARWNNTADLAPYTSTYTANNNVSFTAGTYTFAGMGATVNVGNITVANNVTVNFASIGSTFATGGSVRTINVGTGSVFDFNGQALSTAAGTGFIKSGSGVLATGSGNFTGGFTLNAGTVIARGTTGFGSGVSNVLTLNAGTLASNGTRSFDSTRFGGGIVVGGNVQFGELSANVSLADDSANLSFANNVSLGGVNRTLTRGNNGAVTFSGIISNSGGVGVTFDSPIALTPIGGGTIEITNAANIYTGTTTINGGEVRFQSDGSFGGNTSDTIVVDGGRLANVNNVALTISATRSIQVSDAVGSQISATGTLAGSTITYNGVITDMPTTTGVLTKHGAGTLILGGASNYTGATNINRGTIRLTTGSNRLPTGTTVSIGEAGSNNVGALDLNGQNQEIAGLNSITGTNANNALNNTVTSASAATLTLSGDGDYSYGDGTNGNSGIITGAISVVKSGSGTQTFGDSNTYSGGTTVSGGTLLANNSTGSATGTGAITVADGGTLGGTGAVSGAVTVEDGGVLAPGDGGIDSLSTGALTFEAGSTFAYEFNSSAPAADLINSSGTLSIEGGANLVFSELAAGVLAPTFKFTLIRYALGGWDGGEFNGYANLSQFVIGSNTFLINYADTSGDGDAGGSYLTLTAVPEVSAFFYGGLIAVSMCGWKLRQKRRQEQVLI